MLAHAALALAGSVIGFFAGSPLVALIAAAGAGAGVLPAWLRATGDETPEQEARHMQVFLAGGQLVGVTCAMLVVAGCFASVLCGAAAAATAWRFVPATRVTNNGLVALVPAAAAGAITAAVLALL